jgi:hypothetical protein
MLDNPALIYEGPQNPWLDKQPAPLILLHDGGGTTFSYHCLYPIGRTLYGIHNTKLDEGGFWESGISGMAASYIELMETVLPDGGEILLGGELFILSFNVLPHILFIDLDRPSSNVHITSWRMRWSTVNFVCIVHSILD